MGEHCTREGVELVDDIINKVVNDDVLNSSQLKKYTGKFEKRCKFLCRSYFSFIKVHENNPFVLDS